MVGWMDKKNMKKIWMVGWIKIYEQSGPKNKQQITTQRFWVLPQTQNSHTAHTSTTSQYKHTSLYKS